MRGPSAPHQGLVGSLLSGGGKKVTRGRTPPSSSMAPRPPLCMQRYHGISGVGNTAQLSRITPCLYLSDGVAAGNAQLLAANRITTVINVSLELAHMFHPGIEYLRIPVADAPTARISACFNSVADLIRSVGERGGRTLLHCAAGVSRSATVCIAYLMKHHAMSLASAHAWVRSCRPIIRPNNGFWRQLIHYEYVLFGINTVHMVHSWEQGEAEAGI
uniref:Dual specificity phosphatase 21 n=1 Tax=Pavo cristatus TaxID=9049 RepID=A0A8C9L1X4_PAVCR